MYQKKYGDYIEDITFEPKGTIDWTKYIAADPSEPKIAAGNLFNSFEEAIAFLKQFHGSVNEYLTFEQLAKSFIY